MDMGGETPVWTYSYDGISLQNQRAVNMDSLLLKTRMIQGRNFCIAVVCDGVGSMRDGQFAAVTAVTLLNHWFSQIEDDCVCGPCLREQVLKVNRAIYDEAQNRRLQTATTLSALLIGPEKYSVVHAGDSRIYCYQDGKVTTLTQDHVSAAGKLTSCLGRWPETQILYQEGSLGRCLFLLCSDGLYKRMDAGLLQRELKRAGHRQFRKTLERLSQYVIAQGEKDNISLALVKCEN